MFRSVPMRRAVVIVPKSERDVALEVIASLGVLHLLRLSEREAWRDAVQACDVEEARRECRERWQRMAVLTDFFGEAARNPTGPSVPSHPTMLDREIDRWSTAMERLRGERLRLEREVERWRRASAAVEAVRRAGLEPKRLRELRLLHVTAGWTTATDLERLEESLARIPHRLVVARARGEERLIFGFAPPRYRGVLERALQAVGCERLDLGVPTAPDAERTVESQLAAARTRLEASEAEFERIRRSLAEPLARARDEVEGALILVEARAYASQSESVVFLAGWLPADRVREVRTALQAATGGRCRVRTDDPALLAGVRRGTEAVPALLHNPPPIRPFERLTSAYGAPRWREIDPTPLVALSFWIMFGIMFGDVGHGFVLTAVGAWIVRRRPRARDAGLMLAECGVSSVLFGLAYGSVFGVEGWLPALWLRPLQDTPTLLRIGAGFGLVLVSLSFALGILNAALRRDWRAAVVGPHGAVAACAYWLAAVLGLRWLATEELGVSGGSIAALASLPLGVLWLQEVADRLRGNGGGDEPPSLATAVLGGSLGVVDFLVRGVAHTVSFVRLAAFAVSHAGLLLAVLALAETLSDVRYGTLWAALVLVVGNVGILVLEGLIASVQAVRLVYYEFFSRFHEGSGLAYRPLRLRPRTAEDSIP